MSTLTKLGKGWEGEVRLLNKKFSYTKIENTEVFESIEYDFFSMDIKNRPLSEEKVTFFMKQFKSGKCFMIDFPVVVNADLIILDGQHRFAAAKRLQMPIYFRKAHSLTMDSIVDVQLNAGWKTTDYIHAFVQQKKQDYIVLHRFVSRYKFSVTVAAKLLAGNTRGGLKEFGFYEGDFKVKNETEAHEQAKTINTLGELALNLHRDKTFCTAIIKIMRHPDYEHKRMVEQLEKYASLVRRQVKEDDYIKNLEEVYNYRLFQKNKVRFI